MITIAAVVRVAALLFPYHYLAALAVAGAFWAAAFALYVVVYAKILVVPRIDGRAG
jgi:uncharacterized protein involved in response to NO